MKTLRKVQEYNWESKKKKPNNQTWDIGKNKNGNKMGFLYIQFVR